MTQRDKICLLSQNACTLCDMALLGTLTSAYAAERSTRQPRRQRTPLTIRAAQAAARVLPRWETVRTAALTTAGLALLDAAAWQWTTWAGLAATGVSLLVLEALGGKQ